MRRRLSLVLTVVGVLGVSPVAYAGGPGDVYNDFVQDGKLSCNHSRADLRGVLRSGSLNQYGDPYTLARLKLAVRRQLARGCRTRTGSGMPQTPTGRAAGGVAGSGTTNSSTKTARSNRTSSAPNRRAGGRPQEPAAGPVSDGGNGGYVSELALIGGLLVTGLAIGGWLTRRGLTARR